MEKNVFAEDYTPPASKRVDVNIDSSWRFIKSDVTGAQNTNFDDSSWSTLSLPHTWNNIDGEDGGNYYKGIGWYRKHYTVNSSYAGKNLYLQFDGAFRCTDVYINGTLVGSHKGGFAAFRFDITNYVNIGADNVIAVKVNNADDPTVAPLSADFTFFGGLYRDVHLVVTDKLSLNMLDYASSGVYLTPTNVSSASADLEIKAETYNSNTVAKNVTVKSVIVDQAGNIVQILTNTQRIAANSGFAFAQRTTITTPHLWDGLADPYLYTVYVEVCDGSTVTDLVSQPLGFRFFSVDPNNGFFLNGKYLALYGVNRHQDRLDMGWAITNAQHLEDFNLIKEMGSNAIRTAHYQQVQYFYDLCDQNGMVVWVEVPVVNRINNTTEFYDNAKQQLTELIRQNYNHPSIFFWSIENEVGSDSPLLDQLDSLVKTEDPTRLSTCATGQGPGNPVEWHTDLTAFNMYYGWYSGSYDQFGGVADSYHQNHPTKKIGVSEFGAGASIYFHSQNPASNDHTEEYQCLFHEAYWQAMKTRPYLWCKLIWNMFDFASASRNEGDTAGLNDKGLVTYDRQNKKDAFYWYKANWMTDPFVYITSRRFTLRSFNSTDVKIYSTCDSVELIVNGVSQRIINSDGSRIFKWTGVALNTGGNTIQAIGTKGRVQYTDSCAWNVIPVTVSSYQPGYDPVNAYDGILRTRWAASSGSYPQWWQIDLGSVKALSGMNIIWYDSANRAYKYKIETSITGNDNDFHMVIDKTANTTLGDTSDSFFTAARYIKVTITGCSNGGWASVYEFEPQFRPIMCSTQ